MTNKPTIIYSIFNCNIFLFIDVDYINDKIFYLTRFLSYTVVDYMAIWLTIFLLIYNFIGLFYFAAISHIKLVIKHYNPNYDNASPSEKLAYENQIKFEDNLNTMSDKNAGCLSNLFSIAWTIVKGLLVIYFYPLYWIYYTKQLDNLLQH